MPTNNKILVIALFFVLTLFVVGMVHLFILRFEAGDVYPEYSSLRSDPRGSKALYEGLEKLPDVAVSRLYQPLAKLRDDPAKTLFYLGANSGSEGDLYEDTVKDLEALVENGGRLIISFSPVGKEAPAHSEGETEEGSGAKEERLNQGPEKSDGDEDQQTDENLSGLFFRPISLADRWGFRFSYAGSGEDSQNAYASLVAQSPIKALPSSIRWHTTLYFDRLDNAWRVIYGRDGRPVMIERHFGSGTIVLSADSYFISNEAMLRDRYPELLAWLVGTNRELIFDETHLGVSENPGIVALGRRYRLHGLVIGLLLLASLFVWKNSVSFVPPSDRSLPGEESLFVAGKDSATGFTNLLRRTIPPQDILTVCCEEWKKSFSHARKASADPLGRIETVVRLEKMQPARRRNPVQGYQTISQILAEGKWGSERKP
jgi:hypothetical protein